MSWMYKFFMKYIKAYVFAFIINNWFNCTYSHVHSCATHTGIAGNVKWLNSGSIIQGITKALFTMTDTDALFSLAGLLRKSDNLH
jgi:hypothetical protein